MCREQGQCRGKQVALHWSLEGRTKTNEREGGGLQDEECASSEGREQVGTREGGSRSDCAREAEGRGEEGEEEERKLRGELVEGQRRTHGKSFEQQGEWGEGAEGLPEVGEHEPRGEVEQRKSVDERTDEEAKREVLGLSGAEGGTGGVGGDEQQGVWREVQFDEDRTGDESRCGGKQEEAESIGE